MFKCDFCNGTYNSTNQAPDNYLGCSVLRLERMIAGFYLCYLNFNMAETSAARKQRKFEHFALEANEPIIIQRMNLLW